MSTERTGFVGEGVNGGGGESGPGSRFGAGVAVMSG